MTKLSVLFLMAVLCTSLSHTAQGFKCYQCDSNIALVNCTKVQTVVTCDSGVNECCTDYEIGTFYRTGMEYKYFGKGCKGRKHEEPLAVINSFGSQCCGESLCNTSCISQASIVIVSCLILVSKKILIV